MTALAVWIVGSGGQLGRELVRCARVQGATLFSPASLPWRESTLMSAAVASATRDFATIANTHGRWLVCWTAGAGVVGTSQVELAAETEALLGILAGLVAAQLDFASGAIGLASSAGGVYGNATARPLDEHTPPEPISEYGRNKLVQEDRVASFARAHALPLLIARISNLYGPGQDLRKPQGFVSQILRNQLLGTMFNVYVSLDTQRDFLFTPDCAEHVWQCLERLRRERPPEPVVKIFAHGQSATVREILALTQRVTRRHLRFTTQPQPIGKLQPRSHSYRSSVWTDTPMPRRTALPVGLRLVYEAQLQKFIAGQLR